MHAQAQSKLMRILSVKKKNDILKSQRTEVLSVHVKIKKYIAYPTEGLRFSPLYPPAQHQSHDTAPS